MDFSRPTLHPPIIVSAQHKIETDRALRARSRPKQLRTQFEAVLSDSLFIPLTTVSLAGSFDAYVDVQLKGAHVSNSISLLVDSGNSVLILPRWEDIEALPNYKADFAVLGEGNEPWGCPAKIVRGPIDLTTITNDLFRIENCIFYACTGNSADGESRTANFGAGCLSPWTASGWNTPTDLEVTMRAPLSYVTAYPYAEFNYAPASAVLSMEATLRVASGSYLGMHKLLPVGYKMFDILPDTMWMSLIAQSLGIGGVPTEWPGAVDSPIAMIDTGGTCVFLSDPKGYLYPKTWPDPVDNPEWASTSQSCQSTRDDITIQLGDKKSSYTYKIDPSLMPPSVQGLTLVMCESNVYMRDRNGMNIGGISALVNSILIDYKHSKVGFKPK